MATDEKLEDLDLYEFFGLSITASVQEIKKAYRKKALSCHPDKNPDNPNAAKLFQQLSKALEILTDDCARKAYDKVLQGRKAAKIRHEQLDAKRKKLKEDLEARERVAQEAANRKQNFDFKSDEEKLKAEIERLRKEGSKQVEEEVQYVQQEIERERRSGVQKPRECDSSQNRLKVKWNASKDDKNNGGYNYEVLNKIFSKFGNILALVISAKKKGSALIEFESQESAEMAFNLERGLSVNPLTVDWLHGRPGKPSRTLPKENLKSSHSTTNIFSCMDTSKEKHPVTNLPSFSFQADASMQSGLAGNTDDFESLVLRRLRQAEERKKLIEKIEKEEQL